MYISNGLAVDRDGNIYTQSIQPDEVILNLKEGDKDAIRDQAASWLATTQSCTQN